MTETRGLQSVLVGQAGILASLRNAERSAAKSLADCHVMHERTQTQPSHCHRRPRSAPPHLPSGPHRHLSASCLRRAEHGRTLTTSPSALAPYPQRKLADDVHAEDRPPPHGWHQHCDGGCPPIEERAGCTFRELFLGRWRLPSLGPSLAPCGLCDRMGSARALNPTALEAFLARHARQLATEPGARNLRNSLAPTPLNICRGPGSLRGSLRDLSRE